MANTNSSEESRPYASRRGRAAGSVASRTIDEGAKGASIRVDGERPEQAQSPSCAGRAASKRQKSKKPMGDYMVLDPPFVPRQEGPEIHSRGFSLQP